MQVGMSLQVWIPEVLAETSVLASIAIILGIIQIRGLIALYQDFFARVRAGPAPVQEEPPVPPVPSPPVPAPPEAVTVQPAPGAIVRHYIHRQTLPDQVWTSRTGQHYHIFENCQYVRNKPDTARFEACIICKQRAQK